MVKPNALFSSRLVFAVYSICWAYHDQKIITLPSALKERQSRGKSKNQVSSKFVLRLHFAICLAILFFPSPPFTVVPDFCVKEKKKGLKKVMTHNFKICHFYLKCRRCLWWQCEQISMQFCWFIFFFAAHIFPSSWLSPCWLCIHDLSFLGSATIGSLLGLLVPYFFPFLNFFFFSDRVTQNQELHSTEGMAFQDACEPFWMTTFRVHGFESTAW